MDVGAKKIACTQCAAPLELQSPRAKTIVCHHCGAQLDLTTPDYAFLAQVQQEPMQQPLRVGMVATDDDGTRWRIIGHLRFNEDGWVWDEYLLQTGDGRSQWIQYDDGAFAFFRPRRLTEPLDPLKSLSKFQLGGRWYYTRSFGTAVIERVEGELTWKAAVGSAVRYIDAGEVGVEWTASELELFDVQPISRGRIVELFGITRERLAMGCYRNVEEDDDDEDFLGSWDDDDEDGYSGLGKLVSIVVFVIIAIVGMGMENCGDDGSGYHRGYSGGSGFSFGK